MTIQNIEIQRAQKLRCTALTLFPEMFDAIRNEGVVSRAITSGILDIDTVQIRNFSDEYRKNVDARPVGGGDGMVLRADIAEKALLSVKTSESYIVNVSPSGKVFNNQWAKHLCTKKHVIFLCGRYAGFDSRLAEKYADVELSIGDFVMSGGELPAICMIDAAARFVEGVLGNKISASEDSFEEGLLESPCYASPDIWNGLEIPAVLLSGDHAKISKYRRLAQVKKTAKNRPDLIHKMWDSLNRAERSLAERVWAHDRTD